MRGRNTVGSPSAAHIRKVCAAVEGYTVVSKPRLLLAAVNNIASKNYILGFAVIITALTVTAGIYSSCEIDIGIFFADHSCPAALRVSVNTYCRIVKGVFIMLGFGKITDITHSGRINTGIVEIMNRNVSGDVAEDELRDCIRRLSSEKNRLTASNPSEMNEDDWALKIKEISQNKRGDKK